MSPKKLYYSHLNWGLFKAATTTTKIVRFSLSQIIPLAQTYSRYVFFYSSWIASSPKSFFLFIVFLLLRILFGSYRGKLFNFFLPFVKKNLLFPFSILLLSFRCWIFRLCFSPFLFSCVCFWVFSCLSSVILFLYRFRWPISNWKPNEQKTNKNAKKYE